MDFQKYLTALVADQLKNTLSLDDREAQDYEITITFTSRDEIKRRLSKAGTRAKNLKSKTSQKKIKSDITAFLESVYEPFFDIVNNDSKWAEYQRFQQNRLNPPKLVLRSGKVLDWGRITAPTQIEPQYFVIENVGGGSIDLVSALKVSVPWVRILNYQENVKGGEVHRVEIVLDYQKIDEYGSVEGVIALPNGERVTVLAEFVPPQLELTTPNRLDWGRILSSEQIRSKSFTIRNIGGGTLAFDLKANVPWITLEGGRGSLKAGEDRKVTVVLNQQSVGSWGPVVQHISLPNSQSVIVEAFLVQPWRERFVGAEAFRQKLLTKTLLGLLGGVVSGIAILALFHYPSFAEPEFILSRIWLNACFWSVLVIVVTSVTRNRDFWVVFYAVVSFLHAWSPTMQNSIQGTNYIRLDAFFLSSIFTGVLVSNYKFLQKQTMVLLCLWFQVMLLGLVLFTDNFLPFNQNLRLDQFATKEIENVEPATVLFDDIDKVALLPTQTNETPVAEKKPLATPSATVTKIKNKPTRVTSGDVFSLNSVVSPTPETIRGDQLASETSTPQSPTPIPPTSQPPTATAIPPTATPVPPPPTPTEVSCANRPRHGFTYLWEAYKNDLGCPTSSLTTIPILAEEIFQGGHMFWRSDTNEIYVIYDRNDSTGGNWQTDKAWNWGTAGEPNPDGIGLSPPPGLVEPKRGFGWVWREFLGREGGPLGWALDREYGFDNTGQAQFFEHGILFKGSAPRVYLLFYSGTFKAN